MDFKNLSDKELFELDSQIDKISETNFKKTQSQLKELRYIEDEYERDEEIENLLNETYFKRLNAFQQITNEKETSFEEFSLEIMYRKVK